jgi:hypothetical protein
MQRALPADTVARGADDRTPMTMDAEWIGSFWGKARPDSDTGPRWHPSLWHLLDVAACAERLLAVRPHARRLLAARLGLPEHEAWSLAVLLVARSLRVPRTRGDGPSTIRSP